LIQVENVRKWVITITAAVLLLALAVTVRWWVPALYYSQPV
jgi:hypothetical protein